MTCNHYTLFMTSDTCFSLLYYLFFNFHERILSGKDFDARVGPVVVCVGLIVALVLNFAFKVCARLGVCLKNVMLTLLHSTKPWFKIEILARTMEWGTELLRGCISAICKS